ncbi:hypothetical protein L1080_035325 [Rhodococcus sp. MSC1_016]|jgi:hypothetical protein|uniref:hypothetical protein n=1 Tax=Rhodococcus sp. MSC1_016 TaxID=2909266 RepID=UPI00202F183C|nr:hypothetical protein [Rhodococcus sp. MSC1_016]
MTKPNIGRNPARHPAVLDLLGNTPTAHHPPGARTKALGGPATPPPTRPPLPSTNGRRPGKKAVAGIAAAAVAVAGAVAISHLRNEDNENAHTLSPTVAVDENGLPILNLPKPEQAEKASASDGDCRADRGDQKSGAGAIAAFNFAYYSQRSGEAARALATPNTSVLPGPELQRVIDTVPLGTSYCIRTIELSHGVYLVDLSLMRPDQPLSRGTQTVTTQEIDGRWYVDVFT